MDELRERAARAGIAAEYYDGLGHHRIVNPEILARVLDILGDRGDSGPRMLPPVVAVRHGGGSTLTLNAPPGCRVQWEIHAGVPFASGEAQTPSLLLPENLPEGMLDLDITVADPEGDRTEHASLLVAPERAFQGAPGSPSRTWALAVQLYGIRSKDNWGHGDFTDLSRLIDLAAELGASGIGLNPLHALFEDRAEEASPYSPNSRFFLNPLYIDVAALPEFPGLAAAGLEMNVAVLRARDIIDYAGVAQAKIAGLKLAHAVFHRNADAERKRAFDAFRHERGPLLARFAAFEVLRRRFAAPWWEWPQPWRAPHDEMLAQLRESDGEAVDYVEFIQWIADEQLGACKDKAARLGLPIGLYMDLAVGVRSDSFDAWNDQAFLLPELEIGAPPDMLNTEGQKWGLAGFNPVSLTARSCEPFREILWAAMRHAGAVRLDHVLGLKRFYMVVRGTRADEGVYVRFPFEAMLAVAAQESVRNACIVIGEDLGTVPDGFRETLAAYGLWSYHVMMFERAKDGGFIAPDQYRENALVTFATHDLPTFAGWRAGHDLAVKRALRLDPGEEDCERAEALRRMGSTLAARGLKTLDYASIVRFLAATPSRLLVVTMEDALGLDEQVNIPGTILEHPNWRRRLPVSLEDLSQHEGLRMVATLAAKSGRKNASRTGVPLLDRSTNASRN